MAHRTWIEPGDDYKPGALESSMHWQVIWPRVVALAWKDPEFKKELIANPYDTIEKHFSYKLSPQLELKIEDAPPGTPGYDASQVDPWDGLPKLRLTLTIPPAPKAADGAVAITVYQDTGRTYPFTCC